MKVHNVRLGFANNSSSSHSMLFVKGKLPLQKCEEDLSFGWDDFVLSEKDTKRSYVREILRQSLLSILKDEGIVEDIANYWTGESTKNCFIDHQSVYDLPSNWEETFINKEFFKEFEEFILQKKIVILGGNDNDCTEKDKDAFVLNIPKEEGGKGLVARKDIDLETGEKYWTLFNRGNGAKFRISFKTPQTDFKPVKASAPELVDLKITDFCIYGCKYCYQGSTPEGKHASGSNLYSIIRELSNMKVFECAIGGGEPTSHPNFLSILEEFKRNHIIPNFTTKTLDWMKDLLNAKKVFDCIGSFAYSATSAKQVRELGVLLEYHNATNKGCVQVVDGVLSDYELERILEECHNFKLPITILGFKPTGRGAEFKKTKSNWLSVYMKSYNAGKYVTLNVDTLLISQYKQEIIDMNVHECMYHEKEGKFSMYIDAVEGLIGESSYVPKTDMETIPTKRTYSGEIQFEFADDYVSNVFKKW